MIETRWKWAFTLMASSVCLIALTGIVIAIGGGIAEYSGAVIRLLLTCSSPIFISLLFKQDEVRLDRRATPVMVFAGIACLAVLASPGVFSSLARLELYYSIVVFGLAICLAMPQSFRSINKIILLGICVVHAGFLLIALQFAVAAVGDPEPVATPPFFMNVRHFGYQGFFGASAAVAVALADKRLRTSGVLLAMAALFGIIMFGSRGALLAWFLFVMAAIVLVPDRRALIMVSLLAIAGAFATAFMTERHELLNTFSLFDRGRATSGGALSVFSWQNRIEVWMDSLAAIARRPLLGFGPDGYQISRCCSPNIAQPHNSILQILLEFGALGLLALAWTANTLFGPRVREIVFRTPRLERDPINTMALAILVGFAGFSLIDGLLYYPVPLVNFALICAILLAAPTVTKADPAFDRAPIQSPASSPDT